MWGPRAEIIAIGVMANVLSVLVGIYVVYLTIQTQITGRTAYIVWVPLVAGAIAGIAMSSESIISRQYGVLEQVLHDPSAPAVSFAMRWPVGFGHILILVPVLCAVGYAEYKLWHTFTEQTFPTRVQYATVTGMYLCLCAAGWIYVAAVKPVFTK